MRDFSKKFKDKTGNTWDDRHNPPKSGKYTFVERSYEPDSSSDDEDRLEGAGSRRGSKQSIASDGVPSKLELRVQQLMQLIFNAQYFKEVMADMNYDADKLPLGKLSKRSIEQGYEQLKVCVVLTYGNTGCAQTDNTQALASVILDTAMTSTSMNERNDLMIEHSNAYFSQIPHNFGRNKPRPITDEEHLKREIELLDSLSDMKIAEDIIKEAKSKSGYDSDLHPLDRQFAGLGMSEMRPLKSKSTEYQELEAYLHGTRGATHGLEYQVEDIFRIERAGE